MKRSSAWIPALLLFQGAADLKKDSFELDALRGLKSVVDIEQAGDSLQIIAHKGELKDKQVLETLAPTGLPIKRAVR